MSFFEHLLDLRKRLIYSAAAIAVGAAIGLLVSKHFIVILVQPMQQALRSAHFDDKLYFTSPAGYLTLVINIGLYLGRRAGDAFCAVPGVAVRRAGIVQARAARGCRLHRFVHDFVSVRHRVWLLHHAAAHFGISDGLRHRLAGQAADQLQRIFRADPDSSGGPGRDFRAASADFHFVAFRHRDAEVSAEEFSLCDADHHRRRRDCDAHAGCHHHVGIHGCRWSCCILWACWFLTLCCAKKSRRLWRVGRRNSVVKLASRMHSKFWLASAVAVLSGVVACGASNAPSSASSGSSSSAAPAQAAAPRLAEVAPPADQTGGFDGAKAYDHVAKIVSFGPRPPASEGIHRSQDYIIAQLKAAGCEVDQDDFNASTPKGNIAMKNIIAKAPGTGQGIILLLTHYDTLSSVENFVGAEDSASSTGMMLEMARLLCAKKGPNSVWMAFPRWRRSVRELGSGRRPHLRQPRTRRAHGSFRRSETHKSPDSGGHDRAVQPEDSAPVRFTEVAE